MERTMAETPDECAARAAERKAAICAAEQQRVVRAGSRIPDPFIQKGLDLTPRGSALQRLGIGFKHHLFGFWDPTVDSHQWPNAGSYVSIRVVTNEENQ
jgi:hypothetical protein